MTSEAKPAKGKSKSADAARAARLKAALKANIAKRKAQSRARGTGPIATENDKT